MGVLQMKKFNRLVLFALILLLFLSITKILGNYASKVNANYDIYVVQPGDTLFSIALQNCPGWDPRKVVYLIRKENDIDPLIYPGQSIKIPNVGDLND